MRVALYLRVSTEEQQERETIEAQRIALQHWVELHQARVIDHYIDDGVTGTLPFEERPDGKRLIDDLEHQRFDAVVAFRVDRLARSLVVLLDLFNRLDPLGIAIRSATEPFDTSTPFGRFLFQFLGSMAEFNKATILDQLTRGRDRVVRTGKWTTGPVPFGYMLDAERHLTPSTRTIPGLELTEADVVRRLFAMVAEGGTMVQACAWLNAIKAPVARRYASGKEVIVGAHWEPSRVGWMLHNPTYKGVHVWKSHHGHVERRVPALVDADTWQRVQDVLKRNLTLPSRGAQDTLLRGMMRCAHCQRNYVIGYNRIGQHKVRYYRCNLTATPRVREGQARCHGRMIRADWLETAIWDICKKMIANPGPFLEQAYAQMSHKQRDLAAADAERRQIHDAIAAKEPERQNIMRLYRKGWISEAEVESQLSEIEREVASLQARLRVLSNMHEVGMMMAASLEEFGRLLQGLALRLEQATAEEKRHTIQVLVRSIIVETTVTGRKKTARVAVNFRVPGIESSIIRDIVSYLTI